MGVLVEEEGRVGGVGENEWRSGRVGGGRG